jgi:hypothetical protein
MIFDICLEVIPVAWVAEAECLCPGALEFPQEIRFEGDISATDVFMEHIKHSLPVVSLWYRNSLVPIM